MKILDYLIEDSRANLRAHKGRPQKHERIRTLKNTQLLTSVTSTMNINIGGSNHLSDWLVNLDFALVPFDLIPGHCHQGFKRDAEDSYELIRPLLIRHDLPVRLSGHSLGAATAALLALRLHLQNVKFASLTLFASPKPFDATLDRSFTSLPFPVVHVVNPYDLVPSLPPRIIFPRYIHPTAPTIRLDPSPLLSSLLRPSHTHYHNTYTKKLEKLKEKLKEHKRGGK